MSLFCRLIIKFSSTFFKRWWISKATPLTAHRRGRNTFIVKRSWESLRTFLQEERFSNRLSLHPFRVVG